MTMAVGGLGQGGVGSLGQSSPTQSSVASLTANEFLTLLVTELENQSPLSPMDPSQMVSQTSSLSMVELLSTMQSALSQLTSTEGVLQASALIGQSVTYQVGSSQLAGTVEGVGQSPSGIVLDVAGQSVPISAVIAVGMVPSGSTTASTAEAAGAAGSASPGQGA